MWTFIKIPTLPIEVCDGSPIVSFQKYTVCENDDIAVGQTLAVARNNYAEFEVLSDYKGRIRKLILEPGVRAVYGVPIAALEIISSPYCRYDEPYRIVRVSDMPPEVLAKQQMLKHIRDLVIAEKQVELESWFVQNRQLVEDAFGIYYRRILDKPLFQAAKTVLSDLGVELEKTWDAAGI